jgi:hypothetical protein
MATSGGDAKLFARVCPFILVQSFPTLRVHSKVWHYHALLGISSFYNLMSSYLTSMAGPDPHPGTPVDPRDLLPKPKLTDGLQLKGKVAELRLELNSGGKKDKNHSAKKIALKKIVANMTMSNNDMVALFPDIITCMQIPSLEVKKMYAKSARS